MAAPRMTRLDHTPADSADRISPRAMARIAGLLYLIVVLAGIFSIAYVPSQTQVAGDAAATVAKITAHEDLFRLGIAVGLICYVAFLLLPLALYRVLASYGRTAATLMVALAAISAPLAFVNLQHKLQVLSLLGDAAYLRAFSPEALNAQVMLALQAYSHGILVSKLFWGLWLLPLGWLVFTSRALPRVLGVLLMLGCAGYVIDVFARILVPGFAETALAGYITLPATLGEIGTCLWLLVFGARVTEPAR